jgi:hypothetical protein
MIDGKEITVFPCAMHEIDHANATTWTTFRSIVLPFHQIHLARIALILPNECHTFLKIARLS